MATQLKATQISTNTNSWYQQLRKIQAKTNQYFGTTAKMTQTSDPAIAAGSKATAAQVNTFLTALNNVQSNTFLSKADWSKKVASVTKTTKINESVKNNIDATLTALHKICSQYGTESTYGQSNDYAYCPDNTTWAEHTQYGEYSQECETIACSQSEYSTWSYNYSCGNYSNDSTWSETTSCMTYNECTLYNTYSNNQSSYNTYVESNSTYNKSPYNTESGGCQNYSINRTEGYSYDPATWYGNVPEIKQNASCTDEMCSQQSDYNYCTNNSTYNNAGTNATVDYSRTASIDSGCNYWEYFATDAYGNGQCYTYYQESLDCTEYDNYSTYTDTTATYNTQAQSPGYGTYTVTGNSVYSNT